MTFARPLLVLAAGVLLCGSALTRAADEVWTLTTADFAEQRVTVVGIDAAGIDVRDAAGSGRVVPWAGVLDLTRLGGRSAVPDPMLVAVLAGGERLVGTPGMLDGETLTWSSPLGDFALPLGEVIAVARGAVLEETLAGVAADPPGQDAAVLMNGDRLDGIVRAIDAAQVTLSAGANDQPVPWESIASLRFAGVGRAEPAAGAGLRVAVVGGSVLAAQRVSTDAGKLRLALANGTERAVPIGSVLAIEQRGGPVLWLTDLPVKEIEARAYFGDEATLPRFGSTLSGEPLRDGDRPARTGLSAASYTRLTWDLTGPAAAGRGAFRARYAIDGAGASAPYADVTVRVLLDGKVVYERVSVTAATGVQSVALPLAGAKTIALEIDYGKTFDVQDRLNWLEPALLRDPPPAEAGR